MFKIKGRYTDATVMIDQIDNETLSQLHQIVNDPVFTNPIVIMPDCHAGMGSVIGFTMEVGDSIKPSIVGVDIGCGMLSVKFEFLDKDVDLEKVYDDILSVVPVGANIRTKSSAFYSFSRLSWLANKQISAMYQSLIKRFNDVPEFPKLTKEYLDNLLKKIELDKDYFINSIGTLGSGNHFIELGVDDMDDYWITIHSGSRNFGLKVCKYYQNKQPDMTEFNQKIKEIRNKYTGKNIEAQINILKEEYQTQKGILKGIDLYNYLYDMCIAQAYAQLNREVILDEIIFKLNLKLIDSHVSSVHNYISPSDFIIRKGAISAYENEPVIIPFNMRDGIIIGRGKGNPDWNYSAPHGAGRVLSRSQAKKQLDINQVEKQMNGIVTKNIPIDEAPDAYKDADLIKQLIRPTVDIITYLKPVLNIKG